MTEIFLQNNTDNTLTIAGKTQLGQVFKYKANACYQAKIDTVGATAINVHCSALEDFMAFNILAKSIKTVLDNGITCYGNPGTMGKLAKVAKQFKPSL